MVIVNEQITFYNKNGVKHEGYYIDGYLKENIENYLVKAVKHKWDGVMLITGMEGSGKSVGTFTLAHFVDNTFPGQPLNDGTPRRKCDRIVFTPKQFMEAVDNSKPEQAIVWDEFVLGGMSVDAMTTMQRLIVKKMVTIRKKRLYIFLVIPTIFLLKKYFAILRTRALVHFYTPDGVARGYFKFYNYQTKNRLYIKGLKEWNHGIVKSNFHGRATNTEGYFFDAEEYERKKDEAILQLTQEPEKKRKELSDLRKEIKLNCDTAITALHFNLKNQNPKHTYEDTAQELNKYYGEDKYYADLVGKSCRVVQKRINKE